ncbi:MAG: hypothetical protein IJY54_03605, partial [Paludibacteraceae bacterium]|nr:hypothetical protein [Paludibacteraceae bacterium]
MEGKAMERKIYALMLLIMAWANKYIKSKIGEIHGITKPVLVISVLFFLSPEVVFSQVCTPSSDGSIQSLVGTDMNSKEEDADGIYSLDDVEVGGNSEFTLFNENNAQYDPSLSNKNTYLVTNKVNSLWGGNENAILPENKDGNSYLVVRPPTGTHTLFSVNFSVEELRKKFEPYLENCGNSPSTKSVVSFRVFLGNLYEQEPQSAAFPMYLQNMSKGAISKMLLTKEGGGTTQGDPIQFRGSGWYTLTLEITWPNYICWDIHNNALSNQNIEIRSNFYNNSDGTVLFFDYISSKTPHVCINMTSGCKDDLVKLYAYDYEPGTTIKWQYKYPDAENTWVDYHTSTYSGNGVSTPEFKYLAEPNKENIVFRALVTLPNGKELEPTEINFKKRDDCESIKCPEIISGPEQICQPLAESVFRYTVDPYDGENLDYEYSLRRKGTEENILSTTPFKFAQNPENPYLGDLDVPFPANLESGEYVLKVSAKEKGTSNILCSQEKTIVITVHSNPVVPTIVPNPLQFCKDDEVPPLSEIMDVIDQDVYYINWHNGITLESGFADAPEITTATPTDDTPQQYFYSVTNKETGCISVPAELDVYVDEPISFELAGVSSICKGESVNLSVVGDVVGDVATTGAYQWYKDGVAIAGATTTSYKATPDASAVYKLEVKGNVCPAVSKTVSVEVKEKPQVTVTTTPICAGSSDAPEVTMTPSDGMTFEWVNTPTWSSLTVGTHTVSYKVTSDNDCFVEGTTDVTVEAPIVFELAKAGPICKGESVDLKVEGNVSGVVANTDAYQWYEGGVAISGAISATYTASPESTTEYSLTIRGNKCEATTKSVKVEVEEPIVFELAKAGPICKGESVDLKVDGNVSGVVANTDAYQWYEGGVAIPSATGATYTASPESTTEYSLTIKGNKCEATTKSVKVEVEEPIVFELAKVDAICEGESVELKVDGAVTGTLAENNAYQWYKGSEKIEGATSPSYELQNATVTASADYTLTVSGKKCKSVSKTVSVVVKELPDADLTAEPICQGLTVAPKVPGNWISGWNYGWINEPAWETLSVGVHKQKYVVTAPNGCSAEGEMDVTVEEPIQITMPKVETLCVGAFVELTPTSVTGTLANNPYSWKGGGQTSVEKTFRVEKLCETITCILTVKGNACPEKCEKVQVPVVRPELKEPWPANKEDQEVCFSDGDFSPIKSEAEIKALYGPDCNTVKVTFTEAKEEDDCGWYKKRTYVVTDACQHDVSPANPVIKVSGGDKEKPTLSGSLAPLEEEGCSKGNAPKAYTTIAELASAGLTISDNCSSDFTITSNDEVTSSNCSIVVTRTYTIADACGNPATAKQTITIKRDDFKMPENGAATVQCASEAKAAGEDGSQITLPEVKDACENVLIPVGEPVVSETPACDGEVTYTYTYKDCANHAHDWKFVYTIAKPTMTFTGTIADEEDVDACYSEEQKNKLLTAEAVKAMYASSCNREITVTPTDKIESDSDCGWKITRTYAISDGGCNTDTKTMSVSGSDKTAPTITGTLKSL